MKVEKKKRKERKKKSSFVHISFQEKVPNPPLFFPSPVVSSSDETVPPSSLPFFLTQQKKYKHECSKKRWGFMPPLVV